MIEKEDGHVDWISSLVPVVKQNNKLRICIDSQPLNQALCRHIIRCIQWKSYCQN